MRMPSIVTTRQVQAARCSHRIAFRGRKVGPHLGAAIVVVIAVDPVHVDPSAKQRRGQLVERPFALDVAQKHGGAGQGRLGGEAGADIMPMLVNVADENDGHAVPVWSD